ncbi:MAG: transglycosylase SLT domain-containing protein, partial [Spirochaetia bacterium]|nr:transglycosylase SLT domain-containing protein [Spirochaetia bacterium]
LLILSGCKSLDYLQAGLEGRDVNLIALYGADKIDTRALDKITMKGFRIDDFNNPKVQGFIRDYQTHGRDFLITILERAHIYLPFIFEAFQEKGIPADLAYLPIIESSFDARAVSYMGATGLWQFMYGTGRMYQLDANYWYDDRMDPRRSTIAAAYMFKWLFQAFDNWLLALAAYNSGPGTVAYVIQKYKTSDFWELSKLGAWPRETDYYVPKFIAATIIAKNPEKYGFPPLDPKKYVQVKSYTVEDSTDLGVIAQCSGTPVNQILLLNPALKQWATPPSVAFQIHVPVDRYDAFVENFKKISPADRVTFRRYLVRMGDTLTGIGEKFNIPVNPIVDINKFRSRHFIQAGDQIIIPIRGLDKAKVLDSASAKESAARRRDTPGENYVFLHEVEDGETLYQIALRYKVEIFDLFEWNDLSSKTDIIGGKLLIIKKPGRG